MLVHVSASCLALSALAAAQPAEPGRVIGHVNLTARIPGKPLPSAAYPHRTIGDHNPPALPEIRNVVVSIKDAVYHGTLPATRTELRQEHETFIPHTVAITRGSTIDFPNGDPFFHNVFSLSRAASFNLGRYQRGRTRGREFTKPGTVKVYCDIHSHMSATILVFDHPYFTIPEPDGTFELTGLPAGDYTIVGWHERVGERSERIHVDAGKTTSIDLTVPVPAADDGDAAP
jgi:plastocyanin